MTSRVLNWVPARHNRRTLALAVVVVLPALSSVLASPASAQTTPPDTTTQRNTDSATTPTPDQKTLIRWSREATQAFAAGDLDTAAGKLAQLIEWEPGNFVHRYNLACIRSVQGKSEAAAELLLQAAEHGFSDVQLLRKDPSLANARRTTTVQSMLDNWGRILDRRVETDLERARERYGSRYWYIQDPDLRIAYVCAYDEQTLAEVQQEIGEVHQWAMQHVFADTDSEDQLVHPDDPWVLVVLPTQRDFRAWAVATYGAAARNFNQAIGGHYSHDDKQLVTMDLGATLRHEFMHVLHWRSNTRRGQIHPIWVQEGLCALIEDFDRDDAGQLVPVESWRTNQAQFLAKTGNLLHIKDLCTIPRDRFTSSRPLARYAQSRALFLFMYREGKLAEWYAHFTEHYREDPSGVASIEAVLEGTLDEINDRYADFCRDLPQVPEEIKRGMPSLGVEIDSTGTGEGLRISAHVRRDTAGDLKFGDIVTHINNRPVRDYWELVRVLTSYEPGQTVTVRYRRVRLHKETDLVLRAAK
ncbi:MAG: PDZ domain-containing protein [Planctomycetota bacterium]|nr:PDZ domain-containing protein [Planctomycetota bacterium]